MPQNARNDEAISSPALRNLVAELRTIFQLDRGDLDFGIYRILNARSVEIEKFLSDDNNGLLLQVRDVLGGFDEAEHKRLEKEVKAALQEAKEAGLPDPESSPKVRDLREAIKRTGDLEAEREVYSHLYNFFRRYYREGDFLSLRRYKEGVYALPYEGEEVKLHWANADQYYVKSSENFRRYAFETDGGRRVIFETVVAETARENNKNIGARRFALADDGDAVQINGTSATIRFHYRVAKKNEEKQEKINAASAARILESLPPKWQAVLRKKMPTEKSGERTLLDKHLASFTARNTFDYFIHKDLRGFLRRELDFFIKNEVVRLDDIEGKSPPMAEQYLGKVRALRAVGHKIIEFLAQLENFQKRLWEKRKFVLETQWCITMDKIPPEFHSEIFANKGQKEEWKKLLDVAPPPPTSPTTISGKKKRAEFARANPHLIVDTRHFSGEFKERLLASFDDLEAMCDGVLIHGDNFHALNLLTEKYREKVKCIYIDPPYNTGNDSNFFYRDSYASSSWITMLEDRLYLGKHLLNNSGWLYMQMDHYADYLGRLLLQRIFPYVGVDHQTAITWNTGENISGFKTQRDNWIRQADKILSFPKDPEKAEFFKMWIPLAGNSHDKKGWLDFIGSKDNLYIEQWDNGKIVQIPVTAKAKRIGTVWSDIYSFQYSEPRETESFSFKTQKPENLLRRIIQSCTKVNELVLDFFSGTGTTAAVAQKLGRKWITADCGDHFGTFYHDSDGKPKVGELGRLKIVLSGDKNFKLPGNLNIRSPHLTKDVKWKGGGMFKYHRLESYDDALDNLELKHNDRQLELLKNNKELHEEYMLGYMLDIESRDSASLLNVEAFSNPFAYHLQTTRDGTSETIAADLVETFNYLIGLSVKIMRRIDGVLVVGGETREGEKTLILWRDIKKMPSKKLNKWFAKHRANLGDGWRTIYVNGDNLLQVENLPKKKSASAEEWRVKLIEPEFKRRMFSPLSN